MHAVERLAGLIAGDPTFRQALAADPEQTILSAGLDLARDEVEAVLALLPLLASPAHTLVSQFSDAAALPLWNGMAPLAPVAA